MLGSLWEEGTHCKPKFLVSALEGDSAHLLVQGAQARDQDVGSSEGPPRGAWPLETPKAVPSLLWCCLSVYWTVRPYLSSQPRSGLSPYGQGRAWNGEWQPPGDWNQHLFQPLPLCN